MKKDKKKHYATKSHKEAVARAEGARKEVENLSLPSTSKLELRRIKKKVKNDEVQWSKAIDYHQVNVGFTSYEIYMKFTYIKLHFLLLNYNY